MKKSLTAKMFITLFISFAVLILTIILFLHLYFNYSYRESKINHMTRAIHEFAEKYVLEDWEESEIYRNLANFNDNNNASMYIFDTKGAFYFEDSSQSHLTDLVLGKSAESSYYVTVAYDGFYYDIALESEEYTALNIAGLESGDPLDIEGYIVGDYSLVPITINGVTLSDDGNPGILPNDTEPGLYKTEYITTNVFSNSYLSIVGSDDLIGEELKDAINLPSTNVILVKPNNISSFEKNGVVYEISAIPYTDLEQVYFSKQVVTDDRVIAFGADMSLHSVTEITGIISSLLPWFILGAMLLALAISLFYSKTVSRPIIKITKAANKMAAMELDTRSDVKRKDELGRLSNSLNTLSENLGNAMDELVVKNRQLAEDYAMKERQEESRKTFIANASHELKTPLGVIKGYTEAIRDGIKEDKQDYYMDVILDEISRMDRLIEEMMQLSKFEAGADDYKMESVNLDDMTETIAQRFNPAAEVRKLNFKIKKPLGSVKADHSKIHQVIFNLLANAVKYADTDTTVSIESIASENFFEVYIKNQCPPLSDEDLSKIWERFYKVDASHTRDSAGSGLGLSIVKTILDGHNADYGVYNTNKGVCFYFKLPAY